MWGSLNYKGGESLPFFQGCEPAREVIRGRMKGSGAETCQASQVPGQFLVH